MLRRAAALLGVGGRGASLLLRRRLPHRPATAGARGLLQRLPLPVQPGLLPVAAAPLPLLGDVGARGYARMARRMPPARPDGYSTSDGELYDPDSYWDDDEEDEDEDDDDGDDDDIEVRVQPITRENLHKYGHECEAFMLSYGPASDGDEDAAEEEEK